MPRKKHTAEEIISKLREAEVLLAQGKKVREVSRILGITEQQGGIDGLIENLRTRIDIVSADLVD